MANTNNDKGSGVSGMLPGVDWEEYRQEQPTDYFTEGVDKRFFDAAELDGAPVYQENAHGSQTFILHLIFPTREHLLRAIGAFTLGERKGLLPTARLASINGVALNDDGEVWLDVWEQAFQAHEKFRKAMEMLKNRTTADPDEARPPLG